jgi:hypothetical protein
LKSIKKKTLTILCLAVLFSTIAVVLGAGFIVSNTVTTPVNPTPSIVLTTDKTSYNNGDQVTLTATLAAGMNQTQTVTFLLGTSVLGNSDAVGGIAVYHTTVSNLGRTVINADWSARVPQ